MFVVLSVSRRFTDVRFAPMIGQIISHYQRIMEGVRQCWEEYGQTFGEA